MQHPLLRGGHHPGDDQITGDIAHGASHVQQSIDTGHQRHRPHGQTHLGGDHRQHQQPRTPNDTDPLRYPTEVVSMVNIHSPAPGTPASPKEDNTPMSTTVKYRLRLRRTPAILATNTVAAPT